VSEVIVVVLAILEALVVCDLVAELYCEVAAHVAVTVQMPVPLTIVTWEVALAGVPLTAPTVQMPEVPDICGIIPEFVFAFTVKLELYTALDGAPVRLTVGVAKLTVRLALPCIVPDVAVIVAVPAPTPVARPLAFTVATAVLDEDHVTEFVTFATDPSV
jgi:hypothetical protein